MKTLIALAALCLAAQAQAVTFVSPNKAGGGIYLTDNQCTTNAKQKIAYLTRDDGQMMFGCWIYFSDTKSAIVKWDDGKVYSYSESGFVTLGETKKESAPSYYNPNKPFVGL